MSDVQMQLLVSCRAFLYARWFHRLDSFLFTQTEGKKRSEKRFRDVGSIFNGIERLVLFFRLFFSFFKL